VLPYLGEVERDGLAGSCRKLWWCAGWCGLRHVPDGEGMGVVAWTVFGLGFLIMFVSGHIQLVLGYGVKWLGCISQVLACVIIEIERSSIVNAHSY